jgi:hypothetical protein
MPVSITQDRHREFRARPLFSHSTPSSPKEQAFWGIFLTEPPLPEGPRAHWLPAGAANADRCAHRPAYPLDRSPSPGRCHNNPGGRGGSSDQGGSLELSAGPRFRGMERDEALQDRGVRALRRTRWNPGMCRVSAKRPGMVPWHPSLADSGCSMLLRPLSSAQSPQTTACLPVSVPLPTPRPPPAASGRPPGSSHRRRFYQSLHSPPVEPRFSHARGQDRSCLRGLGRADLARAEKMW